MHVRNAVVGVGFVTLQFSSLLIIPKWKWKRPRAEIERVLENMVNGGFRLIFFCILRAEYGNWKPPAHTIISGMFPLLNINHLLNGGEITFDANVVAQLSSICPLYSIVFPISPISLRPPRPKLPNRIQHENVNIHFMKAANTIPEPNVFCTHIH